MFQQDSSAVPGDAAALTQMIVNLLQNAIQYTPAGAV